MFVANVDHNPKQGYQAGETARKAGASVLAVTHFSPRYCECVFEAFATVYGHKQRNYGPTPTGADSVWT